MIFSRLQIQSLVFSLFAFLPYSNYGQKAQRPIVSIIILGNVQDAGSPQIGCKKNCCKALFQHPDQSRKVVSLGVIDANNNTRYLFEATPDIADQLKILQEFKGESANPTPNGIFVTHAHIGHYSGLMYLGKEALNSNKTTVFAMPRMKKFLDENGPWSQLVRNQNIEIQPLQKESSVQLSSHLKVIPFTVPHRDEFSETVGYTIAGPNKKALFIPDIDKWEKWEANIIKELAKVDYAFLDATFFDAGEVNNRNMADIPHPFVVESMALFSKLSSKEKSKIHFIHFNHTNPLLNPESEQSKLVVSKGFRIARMMDVFDL